MTGVARVGGRDPAGGPPEELAALTGVLERAAAGHAAGVLLLLGRRRRQSRMAREAIERLPRPGSPSSPADARRRRSRAAVPAVRRGRVAARGDPPDIVEAHPELRRLLPGGRVASEAARRGSPTGQLPVFDAVLCALDELASTTPVLLVVEDLHLGLTAPAATCSSSCSPGSRVSASCSSPPTAATTCTARSAAPVTSRAGRLRRSTSRPGGAAAVRARWSSVPAASLRQPLAEAQRQRRPAQ